MRWLGRFFVRWLDRFNNLNGRTSLSHVMLNLIQYLGRPHAVPVYHNAGIRPVRRAHRRPLTQLCFARDEDLGLTTAECSLRIWAIRYCGLLVARVGVRTQVGTMGLGRRVLLTLR